MAVITTRLTVNPDGTISAAERLPQGEYTAVITMKESPARRSVLDLPVHHGPWNDSVSLRREDMYSVDGR
jgi:hypothetical protein